MTTRWKESKWSSFWQSEIHFCIQKMKGPSTLCAVPLLDKIKCWILGKGKVMTTHQVFPNIPLNKRASCTRHEHELRWYEYNVTFCGSWSVLVCCTPQLFSQQFSTFKKTRCLQGMHLVRAIALDSNPPLNVWSVFTYRYCKSYYQYCLTKIKSSLYFTKQLEEDGRQIGEKPKGPRNMSYGVSFLLFSDT